MTDVLLKRCVDKYNTLLSVCGDMDEISKLPRSLYVCHVTGSKKGDRYTVKKRLEAWRYENGKIAQIPLDAKPVTKSQGEKLYKEAYAEFGICRLRKKAFITVYFGETIAMGFEYDTIITKTTYRITHEKILWQK